MVLRSSPGMRQLLLRTLGGLLALRALSAPAATLYVNIANPAPTAPYTNWLSAATNIQDAVDLAIAGDVVFVTNGMYANGGRIVTGLQTNRLVIDKAITVQSVNGASATTIRGGTQMRCAHLVSNAVLSGFTITNGHARTVGNLTTEQSGGGIWCEVGATVANCLVVSNFTGPSFVFTGYGGGVYGGTLTNCTLALNTAGLGGGAAGNCVLWSCTLSNNVANNGGGAYGSALYNCTLRSNSVVYYNGSSGNGGGVSQCIASNCMLLNNTSGGNGGASYLGTNLNCTAAGNAAGYGGGVYQSTNYNCLISQNAANFSGGGAYQGLLVNCVVNGNIATAPGGSSSGVGGGASAAVLINCTVAGNTATNIGGGVYGGTAYNSIIYFNSAAAGGANWTNNPQLYYCSTTPMPISPGGSITNAPVFVDAGGGDFRVKCGSPTIDAGFTNSFIYAAPDDLRGIARPVDGNGDSIAQVDMGAYEYDPASDRTLGIRAVFDFNKIATGFAVSFVGRVPGCADYYWWDFGDGTVLTNVSYVSHAWASPGTFHVTLSASYSTPAEMFSTTTTVQVVQQPIYYVDAANPAPQAPYTNWAKAATSIQSAIGAGTTPGRLVLVTNGLYQGTGVAVNGSILNLIALTNAVLVQSVNGPESTIIQSSGNRRCAWAGSNSFLSGFTLTGGLTLSTGDVLTDQSGGGIWCEAAGVVSNCVISGNRAYGNGGGAFQGTYYDCVFTNNLAFTSGSGMKGGGAYQAVLYDCLLISNKVSSSFPGGKGGGVYDSALYRCQLLGNRVDNGDLAGTGGGAFLRTLYNCVLTANTGSGYGGGAGSNTLWNCVLSDNWANYGGGAHASILHNCLVTGNAAYSTGGGVLSSLLRNCSIVGNTSSGSGGGIQDSVLTNCIVYLNTATGNVSSSNWIGGTFRWSCTAPLPSGTGNVASDPQFANPAGSDYHLLPNSRCINAGNNSATLVSIDLDGNPRMMGGAVDFGAYEVQASVTGTLASWLQQYGLPSDGSADAMDDDGDGVLNWQEWWGGTVPTNAASALRVTSVVGGTTGLEIAWEGVATRNYWVDRAADLTAVPAFQCVATNLPGISGTNSFNDVGATNGGPYFYRVGVR
jgi:hypothetical protein